MSARSLCSVVFMALTIGASTLAGCASAGPHNSLRDSATTYLPATTTAWLAVANPQRLVTTLGVQSATDLLGPASGLASLRREMKRNLGVDVLDAQSLANVGLEPSRPIGLAVLNTAPFVLATYAHVGDLPALLATMDQRAREARVKRSSESVGAGTIHRFEARAWDPSLCVAIHGDMVFLVMAERAPDKQHAMPHCYRVAHGAHKKALANQASFRDAMNRLRRGRDVYGFVDLKGLATSFLSRNDAAIAEQQSAMAKAKRDVVAFYDAVEGLGFGAHVEASRVLMDLRLAMDEAASLPLRNRPPSDGVVAVKGASSRFSVSMHFDSASGASWVPLALSANPIMFFVGAFAGVAANQAFESGGVALDGPVGRFLDGTAQLSMNCTPQRPGPDCSGEFSLGLERPEKVASMLKPADARGLAVMVDALTKRLRMSTSSSTSVAWQDIPAPNLLREDVAVSRAGRVRADFGWLLASLFVGVHSSMRSYGVSSADMTDERRKLMQKLDALDAERSEAWEKHRAPVRQARAEMWEKLATLDLAMVANAGELAFIGGVELGFGGWRGIAKALEALQVLEARNDASWAPQEKAFEASRKKLQDALDAL